MQEIQIIFDVGRSILRINKFVQMAVYTDDINIVSRRVKKAIEIYTRMQSKVKNISFEINTQKIKTLLTQ